MKRNLLYVHTRSSMFGIYRYASPCVRVASRGANEQSRIASSPYTSPHHPRRELCGRNCTVPSIFILTANFTRLFSRKKIIMRFEVIGNFNLSYIQSHGWTINHKILEFCLRVIWFSGRCYIYDRAHKPAIISLLLG